METSIKERLVKELATKAARGTFESIVYVTEHKMNKGGRVGSNYLFGRVTKIVSVKNIQFGVDYENKINNERERQGLERDFVSQPMKGVVWEMFPCVVRAIKSGLLQLRVTCTNDTTFETTYMVDGRLATDEEKKVIKEYTPTRTDDVKVFNITAEKILTWKIGGQVFTDEDLLAAVKPIYKQAV